MDAGRKEQRKKGYSPETKRSWTQKLVDFLRSRGESKPQLHFSYDEVLEQLQGKLSPYVESQILAVFHASEPTHHKFKHTKTRVKEVPLVHKKPQLEEAEYSRFVAGDDRAIAAIKATRFSLSDNVYDVISSAHEAGVFEESTIKEFSKSGAFVFSVASDVMYRHKQEDGQVVPLFQLKLNENESAQDQVFQHLRQRYGEGRSNRDKHETITASETTAVQEMAGIGGYWQREMNFTLMDLDDSFLSAYIYGTDHPKVNEKTREYFLKVYEGITDENEREKQLFGWTPESGTDAQRLSRVNDALKIDNPFLKGVIQNIDGVEQGDEKFDSLHHDLVKLVTADPVHIHRIIKTIMLLEMASESQPELVEKMEANPLNKLAREVNSHFKEKIPKGLMGAKWIDVKEAYPNITVDQNSFASRLLFKRKKK